MRYLIYLRISTKKQDEKTQLDHCLKFIKNTCHSDFTYEVFSDKVTSKKCMQKREGMSKLRASIRYGDIVIAMRLDRICRKVDEAALFVSDLEKSGADIRLVQQPGIKNKVLLGVYAGMAEEEVKTLRARVSEKLQSKKNRNERYSGIIPYGKSMDETKLIPIRDGDEIVMKKGVLLDNEYEKSVINLMMDLYSEGRSYGYMCRELKNKGIKTRYGKDFQKATVRRIIMRTDMERAEAQLLRQ